MVMNEELEPSVGATEGCDLLILKVKDRSRSQTLRSELAVVVCG